jgi:type VI secretion system protein ImpC
MSVRPSTVDIDRMIAAIDRRVSAVVDEVLHHPSFQSLEANWRGLAFVVESVASDQNISLSVCSARASELGWDLEETSDITKSWLFRTVYSAEYGQFGGKPYAALFFDAAISQTPKDVALLRKLAAVAAMAHAPAFLSADPSLLLLRSFSEIAFASSLGDGFEGASSTEWNAFRESEDSRYVGVILPRMLLRSPHRDLTEPASTFVYDENVDSLDALLWGSPVFAFAARMADSFAKFRSYVGLTGEIDGRVLEYHPALGNGLSKIPVEVILSGRIEQQLGELGFIPLGCDPIEGTLRLTQASSLQKPRSFGTSEAGARAGLNFMLGTRLPYILLASRFAHYLKVIERERIGANRTRLELEQELNAWLLQFVVAQDSASPSTRLRYPLRGGRVRLQDVEGDPGWYRMEVLLSPHMKYMGHSLAISLVGKVEAR